MKKYLFLFILGIGIFYNPVSAQQNALQFDGIDDYVTVPFSATLDDGTKLTVEAWVYTTQLGIYQGIVSRRTTTVNGWSLFIYNTNKIGFKINNEASVLFGSTILTTNRWYHITAVFDGSLPAAQREKIYINGILDATGTSVYTSIGAIPGATMRIGHLTNAVLPSYFKGNIDEVRVYKNVALTEGQIREDVYRELVAPLPAGLSAYYKFTEGSGTSTADATVNGNTGTLTNGPAWITSTAPIPYYTIADGDWNADATWEAGQFAPVNSWSRVKIDDDDDVSLTSNASVKSMEINSTGSLTINEQKFMTVSEDSLFNNAGTSALVIKSSATGDGSLIHETANVPATVERYITGGQWHMISSPISNATSNIFFNEYLQEFDGCKWVDIYATNVILTPMKGYAVYVASSNTYQFVGNLNQGILGSVNNITSTPCPGGSCYYTMVGNPYPCAIDLDAASGWTKTNLNATTNVEDNGAWAAWLSPGGPGSGNGSQFIAMGQGFLIQASSSPATLIMDDPIRVHNTVGFLKSTIDQLIRLEITAENNMKDEAVIYFRPEATEGFDGQYDGMKILASSNEIPQIYSIINDNSACTQQMAINALSQTQAVPVGLTTLGGTFTIAATEINSLDGIRLEDKSNGTFTDLAVSPYTFTLEPGQIDSRFVLHFYPLGVNDPKTETVQIYCQDATLNVNLKENGKLYVYNMTGQLIMTTPVSLGMNTINLNASTGNYIVKIVTSNNSMVKKVFIK